jgi:hypothetical protein
MCSLVAFWVFEDPGVLQLSYKPPQLPMYDGHSDPKQFLMSYEATISSYGGNTTVMAKSFVMAVRSVA